MSDWHEMKNAPTEKSETDLRTLKKMVFGWFLDYFFAEVVKIQVRATTGHIEQELRKALQSKNGVNAVRASKLLIPLGKVPDGTPDGREFLTSGEPRQQAIGNWQQQNLKQHTRKLKMGSNAARMLETRIFIGRNAERNA